MPPETSNKLNEASLELSQLLQEKDIKIEVVDNELFSNEVATAETIYTEKIPDSELKSRLKKNKNLCLLCFYEGERRSDIRKHMIEKHKRGDSYFCTRCHYKNTQAGPMNTHFKFKHIGTPGSFKCLQCDFTTTNRAYLYCHQKRHRLGPFSCFHCDYNCFCKTTLAAHIFKKHRKEFIKCPECSYVSIDEERLNVHLKRKHNISSLEEYNKEEYTNKIVYSCTKCDYKNDKKYLYMYHIKRNHKTDEVKLKKCNFCNLEYQKIYDLYEHRALDHGLEIYKCQYCEFCTNWKKDFEKHYINKHDTKTEVLQCPECHYKTKFQQALTRHRRKVHENPVLFPCPKCPYQSIHKTDFKKHIEIKHKNEVETFKCERCDYVTCLEDTLEHHNRKHFDEIYRGKSGLFKCTQCDAVYAHRINMKYHLKRSHEDNFMKCANCCYKTKVRRCLLAHIRENHVKGYLIKKRQRKYVRKPRRNIKYSCPNCSYFTSEKSSLKHHQLRHVTEEGRAQCLLCNYTTKFKFRLIRHWDLNHVQTCKVWRCLHCDFEAKKRDSLVSHLRLRHDPYQFSCLTCDFKARTKEKLDSHFNVEHDFNCYVLMKRLRTKSNRFYTLVMSEVCNKEYLPSKS